MDGSRQDFIDWCQRQREMSQRAYDLYKAGKMTFHSGRVDVTASQMESLERVIAEMDRLIALAEAEPS